VASQAPSTKEFGDAAQANLRLLVQPVAFKVPFNADPEQLVAHVIAITPGSGDIVAPAQLGDVDKAHFPKGHVGQSGLLGPLNYGQICPTTQFIA
jgi:hypothetical protein